MVQDPKRTAALLLAKMAASDGVIEDSEREMLTELTGFGPNSGEMEQLLKEANQADTLNLVEMLDCYPDRFFIALRAYMMAHVDAHFDVTEEAFFKKLVVHMNITEADRGLIQDAVNNLYKGNEEPDPRIMALYKESSFYISEA